MAMALAMDALAMDDGLTQSRTDLDIQGRPAGAGRGS